MSAELATTQTHNKLDLHAAIAEVLPQPEPDLTAFLDTPLLADILREHKISYDAGVTAHEANEERTTLIADMHQETPLFAELFDRHPAVPTDYIAEFSKAAKQAAAPSKETFVGWFAPQQPDNLEYDRSETPPPPSQPPHRTRPSTTSVWSVSGRLEIPDRLDTLDTPEPARATVSPRARTVPETPSNVTTAPKQRSFLAAVRTKIANGWRRLTTKADKPYVPAIPRW